VGGSEDPFGSLCRSRWTVQLFLDSSSSSGWWWSCSSQSSGPSPPTSSLLASPSSWQYLCVGWWVDLYGKVLLRLCFLARWSRRSRTDDFSSISSASKQKTLIPVAKMVCFMPVCSGEFQTYIGRPSFSSGAECFVRSEKSGLVPVFVHGCNMLNSLLRSGDEEGLQCNPKSFSNFISTNTRDSYVISLFLGVLCTKLVPPLLL
jgi:hypothetical protein